MSSAGGAAIAPTSRTPSREPGCRLDLRTRPTEAGWDQIVLARIGLFTAHTESRAWMIPAHRALCVPDGSRLRIETGRRVGIRCLYTRSELGLLGDEVRVVNLDPLTHGLIAHAIDTAPMNLDEPADTALITLLANQLSRLPDAPLQLPLPTRPHRHGRRSRHHGAASRQPARSTPNSSSESTNTRTAIQDRNPDESRPMATQSLHPVSRRDARRRRQRHLRGAEGRLRVSKFVHRCVPR